MLNRKYITQSIQQVVKHFPYDFHVWASNQVALVLINPLMVAQIIIN